MKRPRGASVIQGLDLRRPQVGVLDFLLGALLTHEFPQRPWFDFGVSNEEEGRVLNEGLVAYKEAFGARAVVHDFYEWILSTK